MTRHNVVFFYSSLIRRVRKLPSTSPSLRPYTEQRYCSVRFSGGASVFFWTNHYALSGPLGKWRQMGRRGEVTNYSYSRVKTRPRGTSLLWSWPCFIILPEGWRDESVTRLTHIPGLESLTKQKKVILFFYNYYQGVFGKSPLVSHWNHWRPLWQHGICETAVTPSGYLRPVLWAHWNHDEEKISSLFLNEKLSLLKAYNRLLITSY